MKIMWILLGIIGGLLLFWLGPLKLLSWLAGRLGHSAPCPAALSCIVNNPIRRRYMRPVLDRVGIRPGERVLELGPGPGAFTVEAARRVGSGGRLVAVDIQPEMIAQVEKRVQEAGLTNVETHVASAYDLPLDDASIDRVFLVTVLPEIPDRQRALVELRRVLKPGGELSITEEFLDPDYPLARTTAAWVAEAGFELAERYGNWWIYTLNFRRPA
jgi:ubiquinone/menaquinone biosynthesis C-methylase UbiE